ncbi:hypothetical protein QQX98_006890 [Neonectria punicea]|uniref:Uncharacterized protein n=1 Tax=Neonectria punicea TaxID=979145 RepID=A0ABR1H0P4_9HYPO
MGTANTKRKTKTPVKENPVVKPLKARLGDPNPNLRLEDFPLIASDDLKVWLEVSKLATEPLMTMEELERELAKCRN